MCLRGEHEHADEEAIRMPSFVPCFLPSGAFFPFYFTSTIIDKAAADQASNNYHSRKGLMERIEL